VHQLVNKNFDSIKMHSRYVKSTLRVFGNRMPRKIFGHKRDEVTGVQKTT